ncbi:hypothetical protein GCM10009087_09690 [Sphingomonas oligophenolica]|uniref:ImmA/IrrE family metallo-endopeptidase n=1 Tax=Sphingomonas oligophenolica TaxID=301154 RepID=A0ABU9Y8P5_9SPHN
MALNDPVTARIISFLGEIGIPVVIEALDEDTLLPAMTVRYGTLVVDPDRLTWSGDLLHEAGHIAVTDPAARASLSEIPSDPAEEMAAIAWSYAAAVEIGLDPRIVFHDDGYVGGGGYLADAFAEGGSPGLPILQWFGMTADRRTAEKQGVAPFPHMLRWLR